MRTLCTILYLLLMLVVAIVLIVVLGLLLLLTYPFDKERSVMHWFSKIVARFVFYWSPYWHLHIEGMENVDPHKVYVITVNHQSYLDIPLMYFVPYLNFKWVSKYEVRQIPLIGLILRLRDDIAIKRGRASAVTDLMDKGTKHLQKGTSIMIFPEGTRSRDRQVHLYKEGAFMLAQRNGVAILPCVVDGTRTAMDKKGLLKNTFTVKVLPPLSAEHAAATDAKTLAAEVQQLTTETLSLIRERERNSGK